MTMARTWPILKNEKLDSAHKIVAHQSCSTDTQEHSGDIRQGSQVCMASASQTSAGVHDQAVRIANDQASNASLDADKPEPPRKRGCPRKSANIISSLKVIWFNKKTG